MSTNHIARTKELNLSVTSAEKKSNNATNNNINGSAQNKNTELNNNSYSNTPECSGGVCTTNWKPNLI